MASPIALGPESRRAKGSRSAAAREFGNFRYTIAFKARCRFNHGIGMHLPADEESGVKPNQMARMSREEKRLLTLQKLKDSALQEFAQSGFTGASIDRISEAAGFSRGAFYANFDSKEEILLELLRDYNEREIREWQAMLEVEGDLVSVHERMVQRFADYLRRAEWGTFVVEMQLHAKRNASFSAQYRAYLEQVNASVSELIERLFERAGKRPPIEAPALAIMLRALVTGLSLDIEFEDLPDPAENAARLLLLVLQGMLAQGGSRRTPAMKAPAAMGGRGHKLRKRDTPTES